MAFVSDVIGWRSTLHDVALREIDNAMVHVAGDAMGITEDELAKAAFRVFGGHRVTPVVRDRLAAALAVAVRDHRLTVVGGVVVAAPG